MFYSLFLLGLLIALAGVVGGFMYGDAYGRKHAQYDNPQLREYYSGQCYAYWENQFKKTVRQALTKKDDAAEQSLRLDEIRTLLVDMRQSVNDLAIQKEQKTKKKLKVASSESGLTSRMTP